MNIAQLFRCSSFCPVFISVVSFPLSAFSQGSLTPPGTPAPTMKTLDQVEPRIPINATNTPGDGDSVFRISASGSYYLTGNITGAASKHCIEIAANNVTIDLMGYTLQGVAGSLDGISATTGVNHTVRHGVVNGFGQDGVDLGPGSSMRVEQIHSTSNTGVGIRVPQNSIVRECTVSSNGSAGISAPASNVIGCASFVNSGTGIEAFGGGIVNKCRSHSNGGDGISIDGDATVTECIAVTNTGDGIEVANKCRVIGNICARNAQFGPDGAGIHLTTSAGSRIEGNHVTGSDRGLDVDSGGNIIRDNTVRDNTDNYAIAAGNQLEILLCQIPETIEVPANVKLAGSLTGIASQNGITVTSDDVTIDLDGHALIGVASSLDGVNVSGSHKNIVVKNGTVHSWAGDGIDAATSTNGQFDRLQLTDNTGRGIHAGDRCLVTDCTARGNGGNGIEANIIATISRCSSQSNNGFGIKTADTSQIEKCNLNNNPGGGIVVTNNCLVRENNSDIHINTNPAGILVTGIRNRIESNHVTRNTRGIDVDGTNNLIIKNSASGNGTNYSIVIGNTSGTEVTTEAAMNAATNSNINISF